MLWLERKYLSQVLSSLDQAKWKNENTLNHRCPYCGDSQKSRTKARGFVYRKKNDLFYKCHNCGIGLTFNNFLKQINHGLHTEYLVEKYKEGELAGNTPIPDTRPHLN